MQNFGCSLELKCTKYLPLQSLVELLLVVLRDVLGIQLREAVPDPACKDKTNISVP